MVAPVDSDRLGGSTGGVYNVTEHGLDFQHMPRDLPTPKDGQEFLKRFQENFRMNVLDRPSDNELVFEMIGIDVSFANALRRILLSEVPSVAIEHVYIFNNTSIIHDEVLAHRLGLVPLNVDFRLLEKMDEGAETTDRNTLVFRMNVSCSASEAKKASKGASEDTSLEDSVVVNPELDEAVAAAAAANRTAAIETAGRPYTKHVYSRELKWSPEGDQADWFPEGISPVHGDILLAKLRPGQVIELEAHAYRGTGQDHAKYSPVATACYRLMPHIELVEPVYDELAEELVHLYEPGVFSLVDVDPELDPPNSRVKAQVVNPYACTMSRNFMRNPKLASAIRMSRIPNHFIFSVESVGMMKPAVLVAEALRILRQKCDHITDLVIETVEGGEQGMEEEEET